MDASHFSHSFRRVVFGSLGSKSDSPAAMFKSSRFLQAKDGMRLPHVKPYCRSPASAPHYLKDNVVAENGALISADAKKNRAHIRKLRKRFGLSHPISIQFTALTSFYNDLLRVVLQLSFVVGAVLLYDTSGGAYAAVLFSALGLLTLELLRRTVADVQKQIIYFDLFSFGAMLDFENEVDKQFVYFLYAFCVALVVAVFLLPSESAGVAGVKMSLKLGSAMAVYNSCQAIHEYYNTLESREDNILCFNKMFENDHPAARQHCTNLRIIPFHVVKAVFVYVKDGKDDADAKVRELVDCFLPTSRGNPGRRSLTIAEAARIKEVLELLKEKGQGPAENELSAEEAQTLKRAKDCLLQHNARLAPRDQKAPTELSSSDVSLIDMYDFDADGEGDKILPKSTTGLFQKLITRR